MSEKEDKIPLKIIDAKGQELDIPVKGSLGLLALGAVGLKAWRRKREEAGVDLKKNPIYRTTLAYGKKTR